MVVTRVLGGGCKTNDDGTIADVANHKSARFLPNTTETDLDGNVKDCARSDANYDGEQSYVTSLGDVVVENTGFGYGDNDTASVENGSIGKTMTLCRRCN